MKELMFPGSIEVAFKAVTPNLKLVPVIRVNPLFVLLS